ncbi:MAG: hypothetical protein ACUVWR_14675 [Anaerolineae bacterium]
MAGALHISYAELAQRLNEVPRDRPVVTYWGVHVAATPTASAPQCCSVRAVTKREPSRKASLAGE